MLLVPYMWASMTFLPKSLYLSVKVFSTVVPTADTLNN